MGAKIRNIIIKVFIALIISIMFVILCQTTSLAWSTSSFNNGITVGLWPESGYNTYGLVTERRRLFTTWEITTYNFDGLYCIQAGAHLSAFVTNTYKSKYHIIIDGNTATSYKVNENNTETYIGSTTNTLNGKMSYAISGGNSQKSHGTATVANGDTTIDYSQRQKAIYQIWNSWVGSDGVNANLGLGGYFYDGNAGIEETEGILGEGQDYADGKNPTYSPASVQNIGGDLELKSYEITDGKIGPFKVKFTGTPTVTAYDKNGNTLPIELYGSDKTSGISQITSNENFYVKATNGVDIAKVNVSVGGGSQIRTEIWILEGNSSNGGSVQRLIAVNSGTSSTNGGVDINVTIRSYGNLSIIKEDAETGARIEGIGFTIQNSETGQYVTSKAEQVDGYTVAYTDANGKIDIQNIEITDHPNAYFIVTEVDSQNLYYHPYSTVTQRQIIPVNGTATYNMKNTKPYKLTIQKQDNNNKAIEAGFKIQYEDGTWLSGAMDNVTYGSTASEFSTTGGLLTLSKIKRGTYHIYETSIHHEAFDLSKQEAYDANNNWVDFGTVVVGDSDNTVAITKTVVNIPNIIITGYVWIDENENKIGEYNAQYDGADSEWDGEVRVEGVTVRLLNKMDGTEVGRTITDSNGEYEFRYLINYNEVNDYYVDFDYSQTIMRNGEGEIRAGTEYIPVAFNSEDPNSLIENGSRALMDEVAYEDRNLSGKATTYTGTDDTNENTYGLSGNIFNKFYNPDTYTLSYINLGLMEIYDPQYTISEDLEYVQIVYNDYAYTYEYGEPELYDETTAPEPTPTVSFQDDNDKYLYTRSFYPSDLYKWMNNEATLDVYVVYGITVVNTTSYNVPVRYSEQYLHIESLENEFDTYRYELNTDYEFANYFDTGSDELANQINDDIQNWNTAEANEESTGTATTTFKSESGFDVYYDSPVTKYIQFEVTDEAKEDILELLPGQGIYEQNPTRATTKGYHIYSRNDWSWTLGIYGENQEHKTEVKEQTDSAGYLVFTLGGDNPPTNRTITGTVFEDDIEDPDTDGEKLGNGYKDDDEKPVENVLVELIDISTPPGKVAELYTYDKDEDDHIITTTARTYTNENGEYSFEGITPGKYYVRYTYGNWEATDDDGTVVKTGTSQVDGKDVSIDEYKSTIVTAESAKEALKSDQAGDGNNNGEWYKYLNEDGEDTPYSVAVDNLDRRGDYNTKGTDENGNSITSMTAETADMSVTIENTEENYGDDDTHEETFDGISFGISEQQDQTVEIGKTITNVRLVNTPITVFNGNPETDNLQGVSDLDGETNGGSTYTRVETTAENLYGSELAITYTVEVTNTSDLNYYETSSEHAGWYYMYGEVTDDSEEVQIDIQELLDLHDPVLTYTPTNDDIKEVTYDHSSTDNTIVFWAGAEDAEGNPYSSKEELVNDMQERANESEPGKYSYTENGAKGLIVEDLGKIVRKSSSSTTTTSRRDSTTVTYTLTKVLSTQDDDMGYVNTVGINKAENSTSDEVTETEIHAAEYSLALAKPVVIGEPDDSYLTVSEPTGDDKISPIYYAVTGVVMLVVLSVGVVIIKKKVL